MNYLLGIDIGTSGTKTVLFDEAGHGLPPIQGNILWHSLKMVGLNKILRTGGKLS